MRPCDRHYSHQAFISKRQDYMPCYYGNAYTKVHWEWETFVFIRETSL